MGRCRVVQPEVVKIDLSEGDFILVKKRLNVGESREAMLSLVGSIHPDGSRTPDKKTLGMSETIAYLVDWSFLDSQNNKVPVTLDGLKSFDEETYQEIDRALDLHKAAMSKEMADSKKDSGGIGASAISPSAA